VLTELGAQVRELSGGAGRGSQNSLPVEFGLGSATSVETVTIRWPNGTVQVLHAPEVDQILSVVEPNGSTTRDRRRPLRRRGT
jgi:hypothetical protein